MCLGGDVGCIVEVFDGKFNGEGVDFVDGEGGIWDEEFVVVGVVFGFVGGIEWYGWVEGGDDFGDDVWVDKGVFEGEGRNGFGVVVCERDVG